MKNKNNSVFSLSDAYMTYVQVKETGVPFSRQLNITGLKDADIVKKLMSLRKELKIAKQSVIVAINRQNALMRVMVLPSYDMQELKRMVALQIGNLVPYAPEEVVFDIQILQDIGAGQSKVMVVIVPLEIIQRQWSIYTQAGIIPSTMTLSSFGVWLWYQQRHVDKNSVCLLLDINVNEAEFCICGFDRLFTSRSIRFPSTKVAADFDKFLLKEIDLTIDWYMQERFGPMLTKIVVTGSATVSEDFLSLLHKEYELPVEVGNHTKDIITFNESVTALLGLSQTHVEGGLNLIPPALIKAHMATKTKAVLRRMLMMLGLMAFLILGLGAGHIYRKQTYLNTLNDQWMQTKRQLEAIEKTKSKIDMMVHALNHRVLFADIFNVIAQSAPKGISLFNMNMSQDKVLSMQGITSQPADINVFQENLMRSALFDNVRLDFVNKRSTMEAEQSYFKISCQIRK